MQIIAPRKDAPDYFSRYQNHDFQIQAMVDGRKLFLDFEAGFPGSLHDSRVLRNWSLYAKPERREILAEPLKQIAGESVRPYLVGDTAYPLSSWIMWLYPEGTRGRQKIINRELFLASHVEKWKKWRMPSGFSRTSE